MAFTGNMDKSDDQIASLFILLPILYSIIGILFFTYPLDPIIKQLIPIPLFAGLVLLAFGSFSSYKFSWFSRSLGWIIFSFYWAMQINTLYFAENEDLVNAVLTVVGIFVLFYLAYHEWLAQKKQVSHRSLRWIAAASSISGLIYFLIELTPCASWLIEIVAMHSGVLLSLFVSGVEIRGELILFENQIIRIIFACTAVQSMVIFIGMLLPLKTIDKRRKTYGILFTIGTVYILNLVRNASIVYLVGIYGSGFFSIAHNYIGKGGSLIALVAILFILGKFIPEIFDEIFSLLDLPKSNGPIERWINFLLKRK